MSATDEDAWRAMQARAVGYPADTPELLAGALDLASRGFSVFPCRVMDKRPAWNGWQGTATRDPEYIREWWRTRPYNIGVKCGVDGLVVIDLDGEAGIGNWQALITLHGDVPTLTSKTGRLGGGLQLWYRAPGGRIPRNTVGTLSPSIDTRGEGGLVIAPPSNHPHQRRYAWWREVDVAPLPEWLVPKVTRAEDEVTYPGSDWTPLDLADPDAWALHQLEWEQNTLGQIRKGSRNQHLYISAVLLADKGVRHGLLSWEQVVEAMVRATVMNGSWDEDAQAVKRTIASAFRGAGVILPAGWEAGWWER